MNRSYDEEDSDEEKQPYKDDLQQPMRNNYVSRGNEDESSVSQDHDKKGGFSMMNIIKRATNKI